MPAWGCALRRTIAPSAATSTWMTKHMQHRTHRPHGCVGCTTLAKMKSTPKSQWQWVKRWIYPHKGLPGSFPSKVLFKVLSKVFLSFYDFKVDADLTGTQETYPVRGYLLMFYMVTLFPHTFGAVYDMDVLMSFSTIWLDKSLSLHLPACSSSPSSTELLCSGFTYWPIIAGKVTLAKINFLTAFPLHSTLTDVPSCRNISDCKRDMSWCFQHLHNT